MSTTRIYVVTTTPSTASGDSARRLIRATNQAQAMRHAMKTTMDCRIASQDDIADLVISGIQIEMAE